MKDEGARGEIRRWRKPRWIFQGMAPMSNGVWENFQERGRLVRLDETESGPAGTPLDKGYLGLRCANGASGFWRLCCQKVLFPAPLDIGAMP
jgi:hypothetical protein